MGAIRESAARLPARVARLSDIVALGKPRLSLLVIFTSAIGVWLAPHHLDALRGATFVLATACLVGAANMLNCWIEIEIDSLMRRTRNRPLPAGRLQPQTALWAGILLAGLSLATLSMATPPLTVALGGVALVSYVLIYTPLKRWTPWAVFVGAVPGALPPLMGWTAATGTLGRPGLFLFGVLFLWQLPHFIAISLYLKEDFRRGGIRVLPLTHGDRAARRYLGALTVALVAWSVLARPWGIAGPIYSITAIALGLPFLYLALQGLARGVGEAWARRVFGYSLLYLPVLIALLVLDAA